MERHARDFHKDLEAAEQALAASREKAETIRNPLLRAVHKVALAYRQSDVAVLRDFARDPKPKKEPGLEYD